MRPDSRLQLRAFLGGHAPADDEEAADLASILEAVEQLPEPCARSQAGAHLTASAVVVTPAGDQVCLLLHAKLQRWLQPGGHLEPTDDGDLPRAALREAHEETGCKVALWPGAPAPLDVDRHRIPARGAEPEHHHLDVRFLVVAHNPDALSPPAAEAHGAQWLTWEAALLRADSPALRRLLSKAERWARARPLR